MAKNNNGLILGVIIVVAIVGGLIYFGNNKPGVTFTSQGVPLIQTYNFGGGNPIASSATNTNPYINQGLFPGSTTIYSNYSNYGFGITVVPNPDTQAAIANLTVTLDGTTQTGASTTKNYTTNTLYWTIGTYEAHCLSGFNVPNCVAPGQHTIVARSGQYVTTLNFRVA